MSRSRLLETLPAPVAAELRQLGIALRGARGVRRRMTSELYAWLWLPGATEPVVCGRLFMHGKIRRRTRVVGAFRDGRSALMLVAARLRHIASTKWGRRRYLVMDTPLNPPSRRQLPEDQIASHR
jgi:hypothetical protein